MTRRALCIGLLALIACVYSLGLGGGLIFDDQQAVVRLLADSGDFSTLQAWRALFAQSQATIGRPLTAFSFALNRLADAGLWGMKATNVAIHMVNALLALCLVRRLQRRMCGIDPAPADKGFALFVAALWALHPLLVSSVLYLVQRMELLAFTFALGALLAYVSAREAASRRRQVLWSLASGALVAIGYQAKETVLLTPAFIVACEWAMAGRNTGTASPRWARTGPSILALLVAVSIYIAWTTMADPWDNRAFSPTQRGWTQLLALAKYVGWSVWPDASAYTFFHDNFPLSSGLLDPPSTLMSALLLLAMVAAAFAIRSRRPLGALGIAWFFVAHAITSAPLNLEIAFEHRNYPALLGLALAAADLARAVLEKVHAPVRIQRTVALAAVGVLAGLTAIQAHIWGHPARLATHLVQVNPSSARAQLHVAGVYADAARGDPQSPWTGRMLSALESASRVAGSSPLAEASLIKHAHRLQLPVDPRWRHSFITKLRHGPLGAEVTAAIQMLAQGVVDGELATEAGLTEEAYRILLERQPAQPAWWAQLGDLRLARDDPSNAALAWREAFRLRPPTQAKRANVAARFVVAGRPDLADSLLRGDLSGNAAR